MDCPYDSVNYPTKTYSYNNYGIVGQQNITMTARVTAGTADAYSRSMYFDGLGRVISEHSDAPAGGTIVTDTVYDQRGRVSQKSYPYLQGVETEKWTQYTYDILGRLTSQTNMQDNSSSTITYMQGTTDYYDPVGHRRTEVRDAFGQLTSVTQYPDAGSYSSFFTTTYTYDSLGNLTDIWDPEYNHTQMTFDSLSRMVSMSDNDIGNWTYGYDANGNLTSQTDANPPSVGPDVDFTYDLPEDLPGGQGYPVGRLSEVTDASGRTVFQYDRDGRTTCQGGTVNGINYTISTAYDRLGRIASIVYPDSEQVVYNYAAASLTGVSGYATFSNFTGLGQPREIDFHNEATTMLTYYDATTARLKNMTTKTSPHAGSVQIQDLTYGYYPNGSVETIADSAQGTGTLTFYYDGLKRLQTASSTRSDYGANGTISYQYTPSGNIEYNSMVGYYDYDTLHPHAVARAGTNNTYSYDADGNMISRNGVAMAYDSANRLISAGGTSYVYNYKGRRKIKFGPSSSTTYPSKYYECTDGSCTKHIFAGSRRVASKSSSGIFYYHPDHLGGLNVGTDGTGAWQSTNFYYPYGENWAPAGIPTGAGPSYKYTDHEEDPETGLYYCKARYYDPALGRFTTPDPMFQKLGGNPYTYAGDNPIDFLDPLGLLYKALVVTLWDGSQYMPLTTVKWGGQERGYGQVTGTPVPIAVPPDVDPQAQVDYWAAKGEDAKDYDPESLFTSFNLDFGAYWVPGGPHDYKLIDPMYDAYANWMLGATGEATGSYSSDYLLWAAQSVRDFLGQGQNSPVNIYDILAGYNAGGTLSTIEYNPGDPYPLRTVPDFSLPPVSDLLDPSNFSPLPSQGSTGVGGAGVDGTGQGQAVGGGGTSGGDGCGDDC